MGRLPPSRGPSSRLRTPLTFFQAARNQTSQRKGPPIGSGEPPRPNVPIARWDPPTQSAAPLPANPPESPRFPGCDSLPSTAPQVRICPPPPGSGHTPDVSAYARHHRPPRPRLPACRLSPANPDNRALYSSGCTPPMDPPRVFARPDSRPFRVSPPEKCSSLAVSFDFPFSQELDLQLGFPRLRRFHVQIQDRRPASRCADLLLHLHPPLAVLVQAPVLKLNSRLLGPHGYKFQRDFARAPHVPAETPIRLQVPGKHHPLRRLPRQHAPPKALRALRIDLVPPSSHPRLDQQILEWHVPHMMRGRPPLPHPLGKHLERFLNGNLHPQGLSYHRVLSRFGGHAFSPFCIPLPQTF